MSDKKHFILSLYLAGNTAKSQAMVQKLHELLAEEHLGTYSLTVIDVLEDPERAIKDAIVATPTLTRELPEPVEKVITDLRDKEGVLIGLGLKEKDSDG